MKTENVRGVSVDRWDFCGHIDTVIAGLQNKRDVALAAGYTEIEIEDKSGYDDVFFVIRGSRPETDKEMARRLASLARAKKQTQKDKERREERERQEYEKLKAKYG